MTYYVTYFEFIDGTYNQRTMVLDDEDSDLEAILSVISLLRAKEAYMDVDTQTFTLETEDDRIIQIRDGKVIK